LIAEKVMHKIEKPFKCIYCNTSYSKEKTLFAHMCEKKRRALQKGEKRVQLGFYAYNQFYKLTSHCTKNKTYDNFMQSPYYNAFVKFGSYIANVQPLYTEQYIDYIVTSGIKLEHWCKDELYETYALNLIRKEHVSVALERTVLTMVKWAENNPPALWNHYFNFVSLSRAVYDIKDGKISPWVILNSHTGREMLNKFNTEQLEMIYHIMNPEYWSLQFKRRNTELQIAKDIIKESDL
jgi:hypothetical protein|tara:strand:- start:7537 stop:8247 length:711 start_codon:yes stop_codon:yes gene_type:complete